MNSEIDVFESSADIITSHTGIMVGIGDKYVVYDEKLATIFDRNPRVFGVYCLSVDLPPKAFCKIHALHIHAWKIILLSQRL